MDTAADTVEKPQIYLISPPSFELGRFPDQLAKVLDSTEIACVRLDLASRDEDTLSRAGDALREVCLARDVAIVISDHQILAERLGLDGVHLTDASKSVRSARKALGADAIVGSFCGASRHDGLTAGEAGADYISFGPVGTSGLGDGAVAEQELFQWWSEVVEVPVVAEGGLTEELVGSLSPYTDFFGIGEEIWRSEDPVAALQTFIKAMG
ncbi:thiamine phosphate synthase [Phaeobacter gallaeciensis]|jgi:thiamine-phosphate pyrophosphorylase|uniref:thiamine phosphate synthase n=1 Tax=Phaeobacter gallaeciensis TaxID=60890 RepID=UPI00237F2C9D|nr:thiamine phosphate synthase [Phaeobacter gallaeciensis]MDE4190074.1 thiamine phosphate synthase [Phaeobacter gallaeciensis]MDE4199227.1 thiamine phosphate synthase [Phaeobacter gallaeciensis]MDE4203375.1 thiamine phosphate synthase [Phaeobacter gallaeciensis]MDE4207517.1 thiamine phosphate synthase [Phaeobacter gallaeciensis]MDE4215259.1 thiamine phosphate synthase [Phaeobacter gallaeciensis]